MKIKLPKTIFVRCEKDKDETFLIAEEQLRDHLDVYEVRLVGEYKLVSQFEINAEIKSAKKLR